MLVYSFFTLLVFKNITFTYKPTLYWPRNTIMPNNGIQEWGLGYSPLFRGIRFAKYFVTAQSHSHLETILPV